jgi:hypothetical protein
MLQRQLFSFQRPYYQSNTQRFKKQLARVKQVKKLEDQHLVSYFPNYVLQTERKKAK